MRISWKQWSQSGAPWVWINAGAVAISLIMVLGLLGVIAVRGLGHFWPAAVMQADYINEAGQHESLIGESVSTELVPAARLRDAGVPLNTDKTEVSRTLLKTGNRDLFGGDFRWVLSDHLQQIRYPSLLMTLERREWGNFYGLPRQLLEGGKPVASFTGSDSNPQNEQSWQRLQQHIERSLAIHHQIVQIEKVEIGAINAQIERLRLQQRSLQLQGEASPAALAEIDVERDQAQRAYQQLQDKLTRLYQQANRDILVVEAANGKQLNIALDKIVRAYRPNAMHLGQKISFYVSKLWEFLSAEPREANTEGGIYPAIFGTVMMVILMTLFVTPCGVIAAVYMREYARQGLLTRILRIAVNNLAGVPSIVYGVFGLGFFVYFLGGSIDQLFFRAALPSPTFGTPGLLWASLTLALLTLPVVIVATEEGLSRIPRSVREGSLALGATKWETLWRVVLPMASPAMMTGVILAVARAAGEVAPLMLVGVVKLAPSLPVDGNFPYVHLDQKFMHLGFHIYDVGFQSPNVEAARPLVYATALLLVIVIALLNFAAVSIRNHLREKYRALEI
ncbi:phosphate ABC transporter permease PstA [Pokkaliibacter sp. MBI-7]|uniref:phosphate ABC transporter permease PstA n=1 Tax=Pokkaliibacter sp. MBI-7 TaxID=3040600 RepID=UPI002447CF7D|nr:phosphate ABC transporter permease PstA [Pokkaliibacter sp. MBI-7]MDH2433207.1 phosphate ABC transporter permease PstA [Pokkaliibacter sp. MBI-7]